MKGRFKGEPAIGTGIGSALCRDVRKTLRTRTGTKPVLTCSTGFRSSSNQPMLAAEFYNRETVVGPQLPEHAVNVILYRLLGKVQLGCDLFIRKTAADHLDQLLLAPA